MSEKMSLSKGPTQQVLYGEALPQDPTPYPFMLCLTEKVLHLYTFHWKMIPF